MGQGKLEEVGVLGHFASPCSQSGAILIANHAGIDNLTWDTDFIRVPGNRPVQGIFLSTAWNLYVRYDNGLGVVAPSSVGLADLAWALSNDTPTK
jgi:hypothetical protein